MISRLLSVALCGYRCITFQAVAALYQISFGSYVLMCIIGSGYDNVADRRCGLTLKGALLIDWIGSVLAAVTEGASANFFLLK